MAATQLVGRLMKAVYLLANPSLSDGEQQPLRCDSQGRLLVSGSGGTTDTAIAALPQAAAPTDGSTTITAGGTAQNLFGGTTPTNGWAVYNPDASEIMWVSDTATAAANNTGSIPVAPLSGYETPPGRRGAGAVSVVAATTGHKITASRW